MSLRRPIAPLLVALLASGCVTQSVTVAGPAVNGTSGATTSGPASTLATGPRASTLVVGRVTAPPGMVAAGGGNVLVDNGGNMVAAGGGNMVAAGGLNFRLLATPEGPLANAWVRLADSAGQLFPAIAAVQADAQGQFAIQGVPSDLTFVVQSAVTTAAGKAAQLQTIVRPTVLGATAELSAASTCVTAAVLDGQDAVLGDVDPARFKRAVDATRTGLEGKPWPDLADRAAILTTMNDLAREVAELRDALDAVKADLKKLQGDVSQIRAELDELKRRQAAGPTTPAAPAASPAGAAPTPTPAAARVVLDEARFTPPSRFAEGELGFVLQPGVRLLKGYTDGRPVAEGGMRIGVAYYDGTPDPARDRTFWEGPAPDAYSPDRFIKQMFKPATARFIQARGAETQYLSGLRGDLRNYHVVDPAGAERALAVADVAILAPKDYRTEENPPDVASKAAFVFLYGPADRLTTLKEVRDAFEDMLTFFELRGTKRYP